MKFDRERVVVEMMCRRYCEMKGYDQQYWRHYRDMMTEQYRLMECYRFGIEEYFKRTT